MSVFVEEKKPVVGKLAKGCDIAILPIAIGMALYHLTFVHLLMVDPIQHQNIHFGFALTILSLIALRDSRRWWYRLLILILLGGSLAGIVYVHLLRDVLPFRGLTPHITDVVFGVIFIIIAIEMTRRAFGIVFPILVLLFIAYGLSASYLPGFLHGFGFPFDVFVYNFTTSLSDGMYGLFLGISANYLFMFVFFGSLFIGLGATSFFQQIANMVAGRFSGGAALSSVSTSALMGMITGSVAANIVVTGSFTIPTMKRAGYQPYQAGAIEATSSTGGTIMPPIMGAAAFIMAGFTGIPYLKIIMMAAIPAILYFFTAGLYCQLQAMKMGITPLKAKVDYRELFLSAPVFIVPLAVIMFLLVQGYSLMYVVFWAIVTLVVLTLVRKKTRPSFRQYVQAFANGAKFGAEIAVVTACIGVLVGVILMTGLGIKLPMVVEAASGGILPVALFLTMAISLLLGMGLTTGAAYVLVAIAAAPVLLRMGVPVEQAHFFVFYYACMSYVTPPVAIGPLIASKVAGAPFFKTAVEATKVAVGGFLVPFFIILVPAIVLLPQPPLEAVVGIISCLLVLISFQIAFCGQYFLVLNWLERGMSAIGGIVFLSGLAMNRLELFAIGLIIFIILTFRQWMKKRRMPSRELL